MSYTSQVRDRNQTENEINGQINFAQKRTWGKKKYLFLKSNVISNIF